MIRRNVRIKDAEGADYLAAGVREQGKFNVVRGAEALQCFARIIGDAGGVNALGFEFGQGELQLDELVAAVWSPIRAAAEYQQQSIGTGKIGQRPHPAALIREGKGRNVRAYRGSG